VKEQILGWLKAFRPSSVVPTDVKCYELVLSFELSCSWQPQEMVVSNYAFLKAEVKLVLKKSMRVFRWERYLHTRGLDSGVIG